MTQNKDKIYHLIVGFIISLIIGLVNPTIAMLVVLVVAFGKEIYDAKHSDRHTADGADTIATIVGGIVGVIPYLGAVQ